MSEATIPMAFSCGIAGTLDDRLERLERPIGVAHEDHLREIPAHDDALAEVAEARLRALASRQRERQLRVAAPRGGRQRESAAEARVDVRHLVRPVRLAEALDAGRPAQAQRL